MKRLIATVGIGALLLGSVAYWYFSGQEYAIRISQQQIDAKLSEKLPFTKTYLSIFQLTLDNPRVELLADSGRIRAGLDLTLNVKINGREKPLGGAVDASAHLKYVASEGQFYLADPVIEQLSIQGLPEKYRDKARAVTELALTEYYKKHPVYRLKPGDVKQAAAKLVLRDVAVENDALVITLGL